mgnify:CR=1 FL=1
MNKPKDKINAMRREFYAENKEEINVEKMIGTSDMKKVKDMRDNPLLLFVNPWSIGMTLDRNPGLALSEFGKNS